MNKTTMFLIAFALFAFLVLAFKAPSLQITGQAVSPNEAHLSTESLYLYALLLGVAVIICAVIWYFNKLWDRPKALRKGKK
ncbi:MAG: hypothetical protein V1847_03140 [Candidatus Diapherotrites archaeon]